MWKVSKQSGEFPDSLENFWQSWEFPDSVESFHTVWRVSSRVKSFWTVWKIVDSLESFQTMSKVPTMCPMINMACEQKDCANIFETVQKLFIFMLQKLFTHSWRIFVVKTIYALCLESFFAWYSFDWKFFTCFVSELLISQDCQVFS